MKKHLLFIFSLVLMLSACGLSDEEETSKDNTDEKSVETEEVDVDFDEEESFEEEQEEIEELTPSEEMVVDIVDLIDEGLAFDTGSYIKGEIPEGEYAFITFEDGGEYYVEKDSSGDIIDNENFSSFGYVQVHEAGNLETRGVLVHVDALEELNVSGAKELYEILNETEEYSDSGWYKVGVDIEPGEYTLESYGSGYVAIKDGPVGNSGIIQNDNFDGKYSVQLQEGQYLVISKATIIE